jgi:hypothetical protein
MCQGHRGATGLRRAYVEPFPGFPGELQMERAAAFAFFANGISALSTHNQPKR